MLSEQQRSAVLDQTLIGMTSRGGRVETRTPAQAVVVMGKAVNHVLHLLVSLLCCGWWVPIWLGITALGGEQRTTVSVDENGQVALNKAPVPVHKWVIAAAGLAWLIMLLFVFGSCAASFGSH